MIIISNLVKHIISNLCIKNLNINNKNCIDLIVFLTLTLMHLNQKIIITLVILALSFTYFYLQKKNYFIIYKYYIFSILVCSIKLIY